MVSSGDPNSKVVGDLQLGDLGFGPRGADHTFDQPALLRASMVNLEIGEGSTGSFSNFEVLLEVLSGPQNVEKINKLSNIPIRTRIISIVQNWINCPTKLLTQLFASQAEWCQDI